MLEQLPTADPISRPVAEASMRSPRCFNVSIDSQRLLVGLAILATTVACVCACVVSSQVAVESLQSGFRWSAVTAVVGLCIAAVLLYGNLAHQLASLGHLGRQRAERFHVASTFDSFYQGTAPTLTILVPSYKENLHLVRQTLLSVALEEYPNRRVVLLIDDPPYPTKEKDVDALVAARRLPRELQLLLSRQADALQKALDDFVRRKGTGSVDRIQETRRIARHYGNAAIWFLRQAAEIEPADHTDRMFVESVLLKRARAHAAHAEKLTESAKSSDPLSEEELLIEYRRLASLFRVEITHFERKRFVNLSHEPNKAMNLNSYIGIIGRCFCSMTRPEGIELCEVDAQGADLTVPDADYVIVVDADSLLLPEYALKLIHAMEQPENWRLAVAQSPYLAVPGSPGLLERTAAATVAAQYVVHLGFSEYEATYWVGANAVLRKKALDEICVLIRERGYTMRKYIQDRTHIEDTESTIDLVERDWTLYNCSDQLAYSATPADFGSLLIQRRRWANGGLIVLPRLLRYLAVAKRVPNRWLQGFLRVGYLLNLSLGSLAVLLTLLIPLPDYLIPYLVVAGVCYACVYGADILRMGFRMRDLPHIYALNLMLTPVNLGGAAKSLQQAWSGRKTPFARTPKTKGRTAIPLLYSGAQYALLAFCLMTCIVSLLQGRIGQAVWTAINAAVFIHIVVNLLWDEAPDMAGTVAMSKSSCSLYRRRRQASAARRVAQVSCVPRRTLTK